jgi:two-component system chemotaxis sensor kinase CheA
MARAGARAFGMLADAIVAEQDVLPKRLGPLLRRVRYFNGAAQLGDGTLVPVVALEDIAAHGLAAAPIAQAPGEGASAARRVLVVEDSVTSRLLLKHMLEGAGCSVDTAVDGLDALSRLRGARYDAVVSDVEMPNMDGLALTASIRANPGTAELPVILVTSLQTPQQREAGLRAGADAYFTKGEFDQDRLLATVRRVAGMEAR